MVGTPREVWWLLRGSAQACRAKFVCRVDRAATVATPCHHLKHDAE